MNGTINIPTISMKRISAYCRYERQMYQHRSQFVECSRTGKWKAGALAIGSSSMYVGNLSQLGCAGVRKGKPPVSHNG